MVVLGVVCMYVVCMSVVCVRTLGIGKDFVVNARTIGLYLRLRLCVQRVFRFLYSECDITAN